MLEHTIPHMELYIRVEALTNGRYGHGYVVRFNAGSLITLEGQPLRFTGWLDNGAVWEERPLQSLLHSLPEGSVECSASVSGDLSNVRTAQIWKVPTAQPKASEIQLWNCFDVDAVVTERDWMVGRKVMFLPPGVKHSPSAWEPCDYVLTVNWPSVATKPRYGELGHKAHHLLAHPDGAFRVTPGNRMMLYDPATVTRPLCLEEKLPRYKTDSSSDWSHSCEARIPVGEFDEVEIAP